MNYHFLQSAGLLSEVHSMREVSETPAAHKPYAYCYSYKCTGEHRGSYYKRKVKLGTRRCPDCGNALVWRPSLNSQDLRKKNSLTCNHIFEMHKGSKRLLCNLCDFAKDTIERIEKERDYYGV